MKDSMRLLRPFFRGLPIIILSMLLAVLIAKKYLSYVSPKYESTVKIKLADLAQGIPNNNLFKDLDVFASTNKIAAEIELMKSTVLLERAIDTLNMKDELFRVGQVKNQELYKNSPILIDVDSFEFLEDHAFEIRVLSEEKFELISSFHQESYQASLGDTLHWGSASICIKENLAYRAVKPIDIIGEYSYTRLSKEQCMTKIKRDLDVVSTDKDVPVISIIYKSTLPEKAADFVNVLAQIYIEDYIETKYRAAQKTVDFLDQRILKVSTDLSRSENRIEQYKNNKGIVNLRQESETDLRKIAQLKIQLSNIKISLDAMQELEDNLRNNDRNFLLKAPNFQTYTDLLSTELIKKLKALQAERRDLLLIYTENDERVQVIEKKIDDLIVYLIEGVTNSKRNQKTKYEQLQNEIDNAEKVFDGFATKQKDLTVMNRDFNIYESSYNFLNEKRIEAEIAKAAKISFHRIISPARPSAKPASPNRAIILIVSALLALIGSLILIYILHLLRGKVADVETVELNCSIPVAIKTPFLDSQSAKSKHFLKEAIQLELKGLAQDGQIICLSSNTNFEGRTLHVKELVTAFRRQGRSVRVLDFEGSFASINEPDTIELTEESYRSLTRLDLKNELQNLSEGADLVFIVNENMIDERMGLQLMSLADQNLYVIDSKNTASKHLIDLDLLKEEFSIPNLSFVMNRHLYSSSLWKEFKGLTTKASVLYSKYFSKHRYEKA